MNTKMYNFLMLALAVVGGVILAFLGLSGRL